MCIFLDATRLDNRNFNIEKFRVAICGFEFGEFSNSRGQRMGRRTLRSFELRFAVSSLESSAILEVRGWDGEH